MKIRKTIGITGGSGSGKTYLVNQLISKFPGIALLSQDNYYAPREKQPLDHNGIINFDTLNSIDFEKFHHDLSLLKAGYPIDRQEYTFNNPTRKAQILRVDPGEILVVEGIYALVDSRIRKETDMTIFIDADEMIRLERRINRDRQERGYDREDVIYRMENHVGPAYEKWLIPLKEEADYVIHNNSDTRQAELELIEIIKPFFSF